MEYMDAQTAVLGEEHLKYDVVMKEEHGKSKLHASDHLEDDISLPSKRLKFGVRFPTEKAALELPNWGDMLEFGLRTMYPLDDYLDIIPRLEKEIKACDNALGDIRDFYNSKFDDLEEKEYTYRRFNLLKFKIFMENTSRFLDRIHEIFPRFEECVKEYIAFYTGQLAAFQRAEDDYYKIYEEFAKKPDCKEILEELDVDESNDDIDVMVLCENKVTITDVIAIRHYWWKIREINNKKESVMNKEQGGADRRAYRLNELEILRSALIPVRKVYEDAKDCVKQAITHGYKYCGEVAPMMYLLQAFDDGVRVMYGLLEKLVDKEVIS